MPDKFLHFMCQVSLYARSGVLVMFYIDVNM